MEQLHFITKLLDIKDTNIQIIDVVNRDSHKEIIAKLDYDAPSCPECGNQLKKYDFQKPSKIPYLETTGMPTRILLRKRRFKCYHCSKMMVAETPLVKKNHQIPRIINQKIAQKLIEKTGQYYLIKLKKNTVLSRLGDLSLPCPQDEDLTILPHSAYSETLYQAGSWSHKRRVCQFSERKEGNLFYDVISLVTNMTSGTSQDQFQLYRGRGQAENFIKEMKEGFFGDKTDSSTLIKNEVRMMMSCIAYNLYLFLKHLAGGDFQTLTIKRFRHLFLHVVGKCVRTGRKQLLKLSSLYAYSELFSALYSRIRKVNLNLPVPYEPPGRKASLMMH
ncbi:IS1380-Spn1 transposase [Streptococcus pneumoniae]|uniref:transposase n=1 Tax=Streptococcus pneumoniae TaxID=1313 RepID=UPI0007693047|nr:transposase [Streptococcus pneumoniae]CZD20085.1 IS1380-Spn1 transposase [Streptococcus pneumoniae]